MQRDTTECEGRKRTAKPPFPGSNPGGASIARGSGRLWHRPVSVLAAHFARGIGSNPLSLALVAHPIRDIRSNPPTSFSLRRLLRSRHPTGVSPRRSILSRHRIDSKRRGTRREKEWIPAKGRVTSIRAAPLTAQQRCGRGRRGPAAVSEPSGSLERRSRRRLAHAPCDWNLTEAGGGQVALLPAQRSPPCVP